MKSFEEKYQALLSRLGTDIEYVALMQSCEDAHQAFQVVVSALEPSQQGIICQYMGTLAELQIREIELALMQE